MSLMVLLLGTAWAGTAVWLSGEPDPAATPGHAAVPVAEVGVPPVFGAADSTAVRALLDERARCLPMLDEFDGELAIIRRLDGALDAVSLVRPADVDAVWSALVLQGLAVHRYFPDLSAPEAGQAGVARSHGGAPENRAWADAIALLPDRLPTAADLGDEAARLAYQEQRARALLLKQGTIVAESLPEGAVLHVNGAPAGGARALVVPGRHRVSVEVGGNVHLRATVDLEPGGTETVAYAAVSSEVAAVAPALVDAKAAVGLPPTVASRLAQLDGPVFLVVEGKRGPKVFAVDGTAATPQGAPGPARPARPAAERRASLAISLAGGWVYDGDYLLQNAGAGATEDTATVNAGAPVLGVSGALPVGPLTAGAGVDLVLPVGEFHTLPSGDSTVRLRAHPHLALGAGPVAATVGWWTPWHLGVGARAAVPVTDRFAVTGAYVHGLGLTRGRDAGPDFEPAASRVGWLGGQARF